MTRQTIVEFESGSGAEVRLTFTALNLARLKKYTALQKHLSAIGPLEEDYYDTMAAMILLGLDRAHTTLTVDMLLELLDGASMRKCLMAMTSLSGLDEEGEATATGASQQTLNGKNYSPPSPPTQDGLLPKSGA